MNTSIKGPSQLRDGGIRKKSIGNKTRQRSCYECRRGKRKCIYLYGNSGICTQCSLRGTECIDHEPAEPSSSNVGRNVLRQRVARLEQIIENVMDRRSDSPMSEPAQAVEHSTDLHVNYLLQPPQFNEPSGMIQETPSLYGGAVDDFWMTAPSDTTPESDVQVEELTVSYDTSSIDKSEEVGQPLMSRKSAWAKDVLKASIPSKEKLLDGLNSSRHFWAKFSSFLFDHASRLDLTSVDAYCDWAFRFGSPMEFAKIVQMVIQVSDEEDAVRMLNVIDETVLSEDAYIGTLTGLEVGLMQCRCYMDVGLSRKAWLTIRRTIDYALLLDLPRQRSGLRPTFIWRGIFQADRMISLVVGAPYSIPSVYCNLFNDGPRTVQSFDFVTRVSLMISKVIDRAQGISEPTMPALFAIDEEMLNIKDSMPPSFWDLGSYAPKEQGKADTWMMNATAQMCFFHTRLILHLPNMMKSLSQAGFERSREIALLCARELLRLFRAMRDGENEFAYKTTGMDLIGFMAAVVLIVVLMADKRMSMDAKQTIEDWGIVNSIMNIMDRASTQRCGKIARHSYLAMKHLVRFRNGNPDANVEAATRIVIPFLGTIEVPKHEQFSPHEPTEQEQTHQESEEIQRTGEYSSIGSIPAYVPDAQRGSITHLTPDPQLAESGPEMQPDQYTNPTIDPAFVANHLTSNITFGQFQDSSSGWQGIGPFDQHQDWTWPGSLPYQ